MPSLSSTLKVLSHSNKLIDFIGVLFFRETEVSHPTYEFFSIRKDDHSVRKIVIAICNVLSNVLFIVYLIAFTMVYLLILSLAAVVVRTRSDVAGYASDEHFMKYLRAYWNRPDALYFKLLEGLFFSSVEVSSPSIEIGLSSGHEILVSELHFSKMKFDIGSEYNVTELKNASMSNKHSWLVALDARRMPFKDDVMQTICAVHSFDHFQGIEEALAECRRILKPKGQLVFSLCSEEAPKVTITYLLFRIIRQKKEAYAMAVKILNKRFTYNFFSKQAWDNMLKNADFNVRDYRMFLGGWVKYMLLFMRRIHRYGALIIPHKLSNRYAFANEMFKKFYFFVNASLFYPAFKMEKSKMVLDGRELFIAAEKA